MNEKVYSRHEIGEALRILKKKTKLDHNTLAVRLGCSVPAIVELVDNHNQKISEAATIYDRLQELMTLGQNYTDDATVCANGNVVGAPTDGTDVGITVGGLTYGLAALSRASKAAGIKDFAKRPIQTRVSILWKIRVTLLRIIRVTLLRLINVRKEAKDSVLDNFLKTVDHLPAELKSAVILDWWEAEHEKVAHTLLYGKNVTRYMALRLIFREDGLKFKDPVYRDLLSKKIERIFARVLQEWFKKYEWVASDAINIKINKVATVVSEVIYPIGRENVGKNIRTRKTSLQSLLDRETSRLIRSDPEDSELSSLEKVIFDELQTVVLERMEVTT